MSKYTDISDKITTSYNDNLSKLDSRQKLHWFLRLYRISGEIKFIPLVENCFERSSKKYDFYIANYKTVNDAKKYGRKLLINFKKDSIRSLRKKEFYSEFSEIYFYLKVAQYAFNKKVFGAKIDNEVGILKSVDWERILFKSGMNKADPSELINLSYYLKYCGLIDFENRIFEGYKNAVKAVPENETEWKDLIYGLNHIVIAASYYYQRFLPDEKFNYIKEYFIKNVNKIVENTNADVAAETGVCLKLLGYTGREITAIKDFVAAEFNEKIGFIPKDESSEIGKCEHRNILAVMLFSDFKKLYPGPVLYKSS